MPDSLLGVPIHVSDIVSRENVIVGSDMALGNPGMTMFVHRRMLIELKHVFDRPIDFDAWLDEAMADVVAEAHAKLDALARRL